MLKTEKKIALLKDAKKNCLTEDTIRHLTNSIIKELSEQERYEECAEIIKLNEKLLRSFVNDKKKMVKKMLTKKQMNVLLNL
jgi:hypothetical protein